MPEIGARVQVREMRETARDGVAGLSGVVKGTLPLRVGFLVLLDAPVARAPYAGLSSLWFAEDELEVRDAGH